MVITSPSLLVITLNMNINGLNYPIKGQILSEWVKQIESNDIVSIRDLF